MRIGVDVGGTNTDAVLMDGADILAFCKTVTTQNVGDGIVSAIESVLTDSGVRADQVQCVMIGTTHFTNAFVERRGLLEVGVIRICLPAARSTPPLIDWPEDMVAAVGEHRYMVTGGYQFDGRPNSALDEQAIAAAARELRKKKVKTVAVTGLFSQVNEDMETRAEAIIREEMKGDVAITLSHRVGRGGLLDRENAAVMNASLAHLAAEVVDSFRSALKRLKIGAPFYISQNDGTLMAADFVEQYPVLTFASGPTNSMRGAAYLSGEQDALVADIGGTTTDVGMLTQGFPRESSVTADIGGVRTNFRMPDILALGLGGGSVIAVGDGGGAAGAASFKEGTPIVIGPRSTGRRLTEEALVFGGDILTASDVAVAAGHAEFGDRARVGQLPPAFITSCINEIHRLVEEGVDRMKTNAAPLPLILVGGGVVLIDRGRSLEGVSETVIPEHADVANAIGASIAQIGHELNTIVFYDKTDREEAIAQAKQSATEQAVRAGAMADTVKVLSVDETPLAYAPDGAVRLHVKVAGDLQIAAEQAPR